MSAGGSQFMLNKQLSAKHFILLTTRCFERNTAGKLENETNFIKLPTKLKGRKASVVK